MVGVIRFFEDDGEGFEDALDGSDDVEEDDEAPAGPFEVECVWCV